MSLHGEAEAVPSYFEEIASGGKTPHNDMKEDP
jgi:hypothetical protein